MFRVGGGVLVVVVACGCSWEGRGWACASCVFDASGVPPGVRQLVSWGYILYNSFKWSPSVSRVRTKQAE